MSGVPGIDVIISAQLCECMNIAHAGAENVQGAKSAASIQAADADSLQ